MSIVPTNLDQSQTHQWSLGGAALGPNGAIAGSGASITELNPNNLSAAVPVGKGGTGAADAATARTNLGVPGLGANTFTGSQTVRVSGPEMGTLQTTGLRVDNITDTGFLTFTEDCCWEFDHPVIASDHLLLDSNSHLLGNSDVRGTIAIQATDFTASHTFNSAYGTTPIVVVTPTSEPVNGGTALTYWVTASTTGFTVHIGQSDSPGISFNYIVIG